MKQFKIKDNQCVPISDFYEISEIVNCIEDKTLEQLEKEGVFVFPTSIKETDDLAEEQMILQRFNHMYRTGNIMGFLGFGEERLVIESRFSRGVCDFFFQYLLEKVLEYPNLINLETNVDGEDRMFNLFLWLFPKYLHSAMRKGIFKTYMRKRYNDGNVKGSIDVAGHIKKNTPFVGNITYSQKEYSSDNYLIELIRHTIEFIKGKPCGRRILNMVKGEVRQIIQATPQYKVGDRRKIIEENRKNVVRHAYYHEYRSLQQLCILILRNEQHKYGNGTRNVYGILFDGAWLWEEYVNMLIGDMFYHPKNKAREGAQRLFSGNYGLIYPDFIGMDNGNRIIADTKYKPIRNINGRDYLQILAYMFRFESRQGYFLYPEAEGEADLILHLNQGTTYEDNVIMRKDVSVTKCGLSIPMEVENYSTFLQKIKESEDAFKSKLYKQVFP